MSSSASKCPHCGKVMSQLDFFRVLVLFLIVVGVLWALGYFLNGLR